MHDQSLARKDQDAAPSAAAASLRAGLLSAQEVAVRKAEFVERYKIEVLDKTQVRYVLPAGASRLQFIEEAEKIARASDLYRHVVQSGQLEGWAKDPLFCRPLQVERVFGIDCAVAGSEERTRTEQREYFSSNGLSMAWVHDLAVAHIAIQMATEWRDAFRHDNRSLTVRAEGGQLFCSFTGLTERCFFMSDQQAHGALRAGAYLPWTALTAA